MSSSIGAFSLRHIVQHAAQLLLEDNNSRLGFNIESKCIVKSILHFFATQLTTGLHSDEDEDMDEGNMSVDTTSWNKLKELLGSFFPSCDIDYSYPDDDTSPVPNELLEAIKTQLQERHLQCLASLMEKVGDHWPPSLILHSCVFVLYIDQAAPSHAQPPGFKVCHLDGAFGQWQVYLSQDSDCSLPAGARHSHSGTEIMENGEHKRK